MLRSSHAHSLLLLALLTPVLGCGDDSVNLHTALWVKRAHPRAYVVARTFHRSSFAEELAREGGFMAFSVANLVAHSLPRSWFTTRQ